MILSYDDYKEQCDKTFAINTLILDDYEKNKENGKRSALTPIGYDLKIGFAIRKIYNIKDNKYDYIHTENIIKNIRENPNAKLDDIDNKDDQEEFIIPAQSGAIIVTLDDIYLSNKIAGTIHARATLSAKGLIINPLTIDPNYRGKLIFYVYNSSHLDIKLKEKEEIITLILHKLITSTAHEAYNRNEQDILSKYLKYEDSAEVHGMLAEYMKAVNETISHQNFEDKCSKINHKVLQDDIMKQEKPNIERDIKIGIIKSAGIWIITIVKRYSGFQ